MYPVPRTFRATPDRRHGAIVLAVLAWLCAFPVAAAETRHAIYKCVDRAGVTSIQSSACAPGSTQTWRRDATPETPPTAEQVAQTEAKRRHDQQVVRELSAQVDRRMREAAAPTPAAAPASEPASEAAATAATAAESAAEAENPDLKACQDAQQFANLVRNKEWLGLSEAQVRRLYGWVAQECKVSGGG